jgi:hypothetical protein
MADDEDEVILKTSISNKPHLYEIRMGNTGMEQLLSAIVAQTMIPPQYGEKEKKEKEGHHHVKLHSDELKKMKRPHLVYASSYDASYFGGLAERVKEKGGGDTTGGDEDVGGEEDYGTQQNHMLHAPPRGLNGVSSLMDEVLASTYYALYGVSSVGLRFDAVYGPRGFGVPSTSVPIYNIHRIRRGGVSSDVDLAETAVRRLYRKWVDAVKKDKGRSEEADKKKVDAASAVEHSLVEEAGWLHAAHDPRDFVYVEGETVSTFTSFIHLV